jgi:NAD(P)H dehydrogenase (quinone)
MILLTGAAGKTGRSVLKALVSAGAEVRVLAHKPDQADDLLNLGAKEALSGDIRDPLVLNRAVSRVEKVYHIFPNVSPDEYSVSRQLIHNARLAGVNHFVYHSVLHPQVESMPHHWQKMRVEELLFSSGMDFSVIQPCAYMQNILTGWKKILETGIYYVPYSTSAQISVVDLEDIGCAAAKILVEDGYKNGVFECSGPQTLSQEEVAGVISNVLRRPVCAETQDLQTWVARARQSGMDSYQVDTLMKMFAYYDNYGLVGNPRVLENILGKPLRTLKQFFTWYNQNSWENK